MATHKTKLAADRRRIDVHEAYELGYWSRKFGVTRENWRTPFKGLVHARMM